MDNSQQWTEDDLKALERHTKSEMTKQYLTEFYTTTMRSLMLDKDLITYTAIRDETGLKSEFFEDIIKTKTDYYLKSLGLTRYVDNQKKGLNCDKL